MRQRGFTDRMILDCGEVVALMELVGREHNGLLLDGFNATPIEVYGVQTGSYRVTATWKPLRVTHVAGHRIYAKALD